MLDHFLLLTPLLLLPIIALLAHVGCYTPVTLQPPALTHLQTAVNSAGANTNSITSDMITLEGGELLIAAIQWSSAISGPNMPAFVPAIFSPLTGASFPWNNMTVQIFTAQNQDGNATQFRVTATLPRESTVPWNLCISVYRGVNETAPFYSPESSPLNSVGNNPTTAALNVTPGDLVYAVAFAADSDGSFPGASNSLSPGPDFILEGQAPGGANPIVETGSQSGSVRAEVTNKNTDSNAKGFIFALGVKSVANP